MPSGGVLAQHKHRAVNMFAPDNAIGICVRTAQASIWKCFDKTFSKVFRAPAAKRRSRVATRETPLNGAFLFCELFSFAPTWSKEKSGVTNLGVLTATHGTPPKPPLRHGEPCHLPPRGRLLLSYVSEIDSLLIGHIKR